MVSAASTPLFLASRAKYIEGLMSRSAGYRLEDT